MVGPLCTRGFGLWDVGVAVSQKLIWLDPFGRLVCFCLLGGFFFCWNASLPLLSGRIARATLRRSRFGLEEL